MSDIKLETLKQLAPFNTLTNEKLSPLLSQAKIISLQNADRLTANEYTEFFLYLLNGRVAFYQNISSQHTLVAADNEAKEPLFSELDDLTDYYLEATYNSDILAIRKDLLDDIIHDELFSSNTADSPRDIETTLYNKIEQAINANKLELPSLPEIALRVKAAMKEESITAHDIENIIESDPVIALRLTQIANSPLIRGSTKTNNLRDAIVRIGMSKTHDLVISLAISQLFKSDSVLLKKQMINLYVHSIEIAAVSYAIAEKFSPIHAEKLLLAGLLHDIGSIPVLAYIEKELIDIDTEFENEAELKQTIKKLSPSIGSMIASKWGLPDEIIPVIEEAEVWDRKPDTAIDMCDIINVAHILSHYKKNHTSLLPHIDKTPCFQKLFPGTTKLSDCDDILLQADEKISEIKSLIKA